MRQPKFLVVVDQRGKAVSQSVPDVPDKGTVVKAFGVLLKEFLAQPSVQFLADAVSTRQKFVEDGGLPAARLHSAGACRAGFLHAPRGYQQLQQPLVDGHFARIDSRQTMPSSSSVCSANAAQRALHAWAASDSSIAAASAGCGRCAGAVAGSAILFF